MIRRGPTRMNGNGTAGFALQRSIVEIEQFKIRAKSELERSFGIALRFLSVMVYRLFFGIFRYRLHRIDIIRYAGARGERIGCTCCIDELLEPGVYRIRVVICHSWLSFLLGAEVYGIFRVGMRFRRSHVRGVRQAD